MTETLTLNTVFSRKPKMLGEWFETSKGKQFSSILLSSSTESKNIYIIELNHFVVRQKLTQHCISTIPQLKYMYIHTHCLYICVCVCILKSITSYEGHHCKRNQQKLCVLTLESYASYWSLPVAFKQYSADQG